MKKIRYNFSLIELLAASAIFAILMVVTMSIFSLSMDVLSKNVSNSKISASTKIALDYIEDMLKNSYREDLFSDSAKDSHLRGGELFTSSNNSIEFASTAAPDYLAFRSIASFEAKELNEARYGLFGIALNKQENSQNYGNLLVVFDVGNDGIANDSSNWAAYETHYTTLLNNVTRFSITAYDNEFGTNDLDATNIKYLQINLETLAPEDFEIWRNMNTGGAKNDFYNEKAFVFSRIVTLP